MDLPRELRPFVDELGRFKAWPARQKFQRMALNLLATRFEPSRQYSEPEVNALLNEHHTFNDAAMLRRALYDFGYVDRTRDCARYWKLALDPDRP